MEAATHEKRIEMKICETEIRSWNHKFLSRVLIAHDKVWRCSKRNRFLKPSERTTRPWRLTNWSKICSLNSDKTEHPTVRLRTTCVNLAHYYHSRNLVIFASFVFTSSADTWIQIVQINGIPLGRCNDFIIDGVLSPNPAAALILLLV